MDISQLKKILRESGLSPNKKMGQNFLVDRNIRDKILENVPLSKDTTVLEIGPGFGMMTFAMAERCRRLYAVEKDAGICGIMTGPFNETGNIELINADILDLDIGSLAMAGGARLLVYGNVPYYITTPIIEKIIGARSMVSDLYMVLQEELAQRLLSPPGSRVYGSISCYVRYYSQVRKIFKIKKTCFYPKPQVDSCLISLKMLKEPSVKVEDESLMFRVIRKAFSQRRKKAVNPLSDSAFMAISREKWQEIFRLCGIDPSARAEAISLEEYAAISDAVGLRAER
jgi:16S rRNA (adenine1518-N6/adenine1519-N6)-dimethyltransferase